jgi:UDP-glucose:(heptosyl)LPS alpha-1,3-glucosyltransferase
MKLGLVRRGFSGTGGAEAYLRRFAKAARAAGHECVLFASGDWPASSWDGDCVRISGSTPRAFAFALRLVRPRERCDFLFSFERVWECDAYRAGDGVHAAWLDRRAGPWWRRLFRHFQRKHRDLLSMERVLFTVGAPTIIANSAMVKNEIMERYGTPADRIHVVHNGVPAWRGEPALREETRTRLGLAENDYALLFAGSGWERKGLRIVLEAVRRVPGAKLFVAGRGKRRGLPKCDSATFLGPQGGAEMRALLSAVDVFVLPTLYDPFSNACLEALSAGLPVLTTSANGFAEIVEPGVEGEVIADPMDIAAFASAISKWSDVAKRQSIRGRLIAKGAEFGIEKNLQETLGIIESSMR